jgi:hypothetical protein
VLCCVRTVLRLCWGRKATVGSAVDHEGEIERPSKSHLGCGICNYVWVMGKLLLSERK